MGSRVLRSKVDGVMADFAVLGILPVVLGGVHMLGLIGVHLLGLIGVYRVAEALVDGDQAGASALSDFIGGGGIFAR